MNYDFLPLARLGGDGVTDEERRECLYPRAEGRIQFHGTGRYMPGFSDDGEVDGLIYPQSFLLLEASRDYVSDWQAMESYELRYTLEGEGLLEYGSRSYVIRKGEGYLIDCRRAHRSRTSGERWVSTCLNFNGMPAAPLVEAYLQSGGVKFSEGMFPSFEPLQMHLLQCTQKHSDYRAHEVSCVFYMLLTDLLIAHSRISGVAETIEKIMAYLQANYASRLTVADLSRQFGISRTHLTRQFRAYTGFAPHEYLTRLRLYNARQLLRTTALSVEDISGRIGFADPAYFIRAFRKQEGVTPLRFRQCRRDRT